MSFVIANPEMLAAAATDLGWAQARRRQQW